MNYRCDHVIFLIRWVVLFGGNMYSNVYSMAVAQLLIATQRFFFKWWHKTEQNECIPLLKFKYPTYIYDGEESHKHLL